MDRPKPVNIAKWGAACSPCALAKAKCLRSNNNAHGSKCDRCMRLDKNCVNQVHKPRKKRQSKPSKTAQLEERLNSLVDLLKATSSSTDALDSSSHTAPLDPRPPRTGHPPRASSSSSPLKQQPVDPDKRGYLDHDHHHGIPSPSASLPDTDTLPAVVPLTYNDHGPSGCICRAPVGEPPAAPEPDDVLFSHFVNDLMPDYPFVSIPPGTTAQELSAARPFLFDVIKMVSSYRDLASMRAQSYFVMKHLSETMMLRSERSLELLQSILLVLGFYHYHCMMHAQMTNLAVLAYSLTADMGINRSPESQEKTRLPLLNPERPRARTNDERRALCGVWYMTSIIAMSFQRIDPIRFTPYMEQCLGELESSGDGQGDSLIVHVVRLQHLSEQIVQLHAGAHATTNEVPGFPRPPIHSYVNHFQAELDRFKAGIPPHLQSNRLLACHINTATLRLWEPPVIDTAMLEKISSSFRSITLGGGGGTAAQRQQLDVFYRSNAALRAWFQTWLAIDPADYRLLPMAACAQLVGAVTMLSRWAKLSSPDPVGGGGSSSSSIISHPSMATVAGGLLDPSSAAVGGSAGPTSPNPGSTTSSTGAAAVAAVPPQDACAVPAAVSAIKAHFLSQPELRIDILGILQALVSRFDEARRMAMPPSRASPTAVADEAAAAATGEQQRRPAAANNIWGLAAHKINITRLKLERWAEIVAAMGGDPLLGYTVGGGLDAGAGSSTTGSRASTGPADSSDLGSDAGGLADRSATAYPIQGLGLQYGGVGVSLQEPQQQQQQQQHHFGSLHHQHRLPHQQQQQQHHNQQQQQHHQQPAPHLQAQDPWQNNPGWANDLFDNLGLDQNFFFEGPIDYGSAALGGLGPGGM